MQRFGPSRYHLVDTELDLLISGFIKDGPIKQRAFVFDLHTAGREGPFTFAFNEHFVLQTTWRVHHTISGLVFRQELISRFLIELSKIRRLGADQILTTQLQAVITRTGNDVVPGGKTSIKFLGLGLS